MKKKSRVARKKSGTALVGIIMGSTSDWETLEHTASTLRELGVPHETRVVSAHRTPDLLFEYAENAQKRGIQVIIAGAGGAAHLPGMVAAITSLPVIGVPVPIGHMQGQDALLSIVQMPKGVPVATVAVGNAWNAGVLAAQIIGAGGASSDEALLDRIAAYKSGLREQVLKKKLPQI